MQPVNPIAQAIERVVELTCSYEIWRSLTDRENQERFGTPREIYYEFFFTVIRSLESSIVVIIYQLFEARRRDVVSIDTLRKILPDHCRELSDRIKSDVAEKEDLISRITSLRHKVYAHRDKTLTPQDVYGAAKITPNEYQSVVVLAQKCVASLAEAFGERQEKLFLEELKLHSDLANKELLKIMLALNRGESPLA